MKWLKLRLRIFVYRMFTDEHLALKFTAVNVALLLLLFAIQKMV